jgi:hypothetical protein
MEKKGLLAKKTVDGTNALVKEYRYKRLDDLSLKVVLED